MTDCPPVSVIVVSHGRPALLRRALIGIGQVFYRPFELIVVADAEGLAAISDLPFASHIKTAVQNSANISAARNAGLSLSSGQIVAFIDDDAVPEPTWLNHLVSPLLDTDNAAATGTVLGRNGIGVQWANRVVDRLGRTFPAPPGPLPDGLAVKLEGTNMAIRREVAVALGGFDEGFGFYLDETDLAFRLMRAGHRVIHALPATVHHGYAASERRTEDRVPLSLFQIGQSSMHYLQKHATGDEVDQGLAAIRAEQSERVERLVLTGALTMESGAALLDGFEAGLDAGRTISAPSFQGSRTGTAFQPLQHGSAPAPALLTGRWFSRSGLQRQAKSLAQDGRSVTLMVFDHTIKAHRVVFTPEGYWLQSGGLFGRSTRNQRLFMVWSLGGRIRSEIERQKKIRWIFNVPECNTV